MGTAIINSLKMALPILGLLFPLPLLSAPPADWDAGTNPTPLLDTATFRWWASGTSTKLRGALVFLPGRNGDARGMVNDTEWQELARKESLALIGCSFVKQSTNVYQDDPDGKIASLINKAISTLAAANGHAYLKTPPLAFWGTSAGSNLAERYATRFPQRVIAIASIKGTWGPRNYTPEKGDIPWLLCVGKQDKPDWVATSLKFYNEGKAAKALWTLALHPTEGHSAGKTKPLAITFLSSIIPLRLGPASATPNNIIKKLPFPNHWLGNPDLLEAQSFANYLSTKSEATWLPDEKTARAWQSYLKPEPPKPPKNIPQESPPAVLPTTLPQTESSPSQGNPPQQTTNASSENNPEEATDPASDQPAPPPPNTPPPENNGSESEPPAQQPPPMQEASQLSETEPEETPDPA